jgi:hypothetical protein
MMMQLIGGKEEAEVTHPWLDLVPLPRAAPQVLQNDVSFAPPMQK